jgi:hypothetical protein
MLKNILHKKALLFVTSSFFLSNVSLGTPSISAARTVGRWTPEENEKLTAIVKELGPGKWKIIAERFLDRTPQQCREHWNATLDPAIRRGPWAPEENESLTEAVRRLGTKDWSEIAKCVPNRTTKQCHRHWNMTSNPAIQRGPWTSTEDESLIEAVEKIGLDNWKTIAECVPDRTGQQCRRRYIALVANWKRISYQEAADWVAKWKNNPNEIPSVADFANLPPVRQSAPPPFHSVGGSTEVSADEDPDTIPDAADPLTPPSLEADRDPDVTFDATSQQVETWPFLSLSTG